MNEKGASPIKLKIAHPLDAAHDAQRSVEDRPTPLFERKFPVQTTPSILSASPPPSLIASFQERRPSSNLDHQSPGSSAAAEGEWEDSPDVKSMVRKIRGVQRDYRLYRSSGQKPLSPPVNIGGQDVGDILAHRHRTGFQYFVAGSQGKWVPIKKGGAHPSLEAYEMNVANDIPRWIKSQSALTETRKEAVLRNVALAERITFGHAPPFPGGGTVGGVQSYGNADDDDVNGEIYEDLNPESLPWYPFANARDAKSERPGKPGGSQGKPGAGGYSLPGTLNWDPASYKAVQLKLQVLSKALFNKTQNYEAQSVDAKSAYAKSALDMLPFLADYPNGWPADAFAEMYLKNTSDEFARKQKLYLALGTGKRKRTIQA
ncbi:hypothetical protein FA13DRAFT_1795163 [Coprinellus micaceus]|uniref:Uncharacterized protein n=1 Tax=Coprinellus micaceus TaxID=71717 RepID=A0A4Y7SYH5_COPMI|nr:hypothetical protein FA13DRAFT_1795163 [Coprinellus micaceus]